MTPTGPPRETVTGRSVVVLSDDVRGDPDAVAAAVRSLTTIDDLVATTDFGDLILDVERMAAADAIVFDALGIAIVARDPGELIASIAKRGAGAAVVAVEPELVQHAIAVEEQPAAAARFEDDDEFTWGLRATAADVATATGKGIRIAVLDTGVDAAHPDFAGREITTRSFITGAPAADGHGHGTHCIGTAAGSADPAQGRRYGVAPEAAIFAGKVLDDSGSGADAGILAGIDWAITNGCEIVSLSLGANIRSVSTAYETVGQRALAAGTLIVAAAGNNASRRLGNLGFVGVPANSPSIMAVAALDSELRIADFSAASNPVEGGQIDIAGPGVGVYSSWPMPRRTNTISGTSMATPHVAGIAALYAQATGARAQALWTALVDAAQEVALPATDAGAGLVRAPAPS
jgi:subtilisin